MDYSWSQQLTLSPQIPRVSAKPRELRLRSIKSQHAFSSVLCVFPHAVCCGEFGDGFQIHLDPQAASQALQGCQEGIQGEIASGQRDDKRILAGGLPLPFSTCDLWRPTCIPQCFSFHTCQL